MLGENGLIKSAQNARELAEIDDEISTIKRASLAALIRTKANDISKDELDKSLEGEFGSKASYTLDEDENLYIVNITKSKRSYLVDKEGNVSQRGKWGADYTTGRISINGEEVKSGNVYLEIGDTIAGYDPTDGATINEVISYGESTPEHPYANGYADTVFRLQPGEGEDEQTVSYDLSKGWKLLGVTASGNLMITTADVVYPVSGGYDDNGTLKYPLYGRTGYKYAIEELDKISSLYGQGNMAISSRSMKVEDVNKVTGYNPENIDGNGTPYGNGTIGEYGNEITYSWEADNANKPYYSYGVNESLVHGNLRNSHSGGFYYWSEENSNFLGPIASSKIGNITTSINTFYGYNRSEMVYRNSKKENLFFLNDTYFLSSCWIKTTIWCPVWGVFEISKFYINYGYGELANSSNGQSLTSFAIRPVVILDNSVQINYTNGIWTVSAE